MWYTDDLTIQSIKKETNSYGSIDIEWQTVKVIKVDAQPMSKEKAEKDWGLTDANQYLQVYAPTGSELQEGLEVKYNNISWLVRVVNVWDKIGESDHVHAILSRVI